ncbi:MAG: hypothetical protein ACREEM_12790 [Blastocatellia bacterium]
MQNRSPKIYRIASALLIVVLCNFVGALNTVQVLAAEKKAEDVQLTGQMIVSGSVTVNDRKAVTGTTVFTNSKIAVACAKGNSAIVNLGRLGRVELTPGSKIMLKFVDGVISGDLLEGKAVVSTPAGTKVSINTPDGVIAVEGKEATVTPVNSQRGVRCVPAVMSGNSNAISSLSPGALAAILLGAGGAAAAGAAVASSTNTNAASGLIP